MEGEEMRLWKAEMARLSFGRDDNMEALSLQRLKHKVLLIYQTKREYRNQTKPITQSRKVNQTLSGPHILYEPLMWMP